MKKIIIALIAVSLISTPAFAIGDVERGVIIGAASLLGIQQLFGAREREVIYVDRDYRPRHRGYREYRPAPQDCIWLTQYDRYTGETIGYKRYCR